MSRRVSAAAGFLPRRLKGDIAAGQTFIAIANYFDSKFRRIARDLGALEQSYGALIDANTMAALDYFESFPGRAIVVETKPRAVLAPAVCFHAYELLQNTTLPATPWILSASGPCFRDEGKTVRETPERLRSFTMREIIFFGEPGQVLSIRKKIIGRMAGILKSAKMSAVIEEASDPFFMSGEWRGKVLLQQVRQMKLELRSRIGRRKMALASFNLHGQFFARRMEIRLPDGSFAESGCAAFGLERWTYAFLNGHGAEPRAWPRIVRKHVERHAEVQ